MKLLVIAAFALASGVLAHGNDEQNPKWHIFGGPSKFSGEGKTTTKPAFAFPQIKVNPLCGPCNTFVDAVLTNVRNNAKNVLNAVDGPKRFCQQIQSLPFYDYPVCRLIIEKVAPTVEDLLTLKSLTGKQVCHQFFGCPTEEIQRNGPLGSMKFMDDFLEYEHTLPAGDYKLPNIPKQVSQAISELKCDGCHIVLKYVEASLNNTAVRNWVTAELKQVCVMVPAMMQDSCRQLIAEQGTRLLDEAAKLLLPGTFCAKIKFCPTETIKPTLLEQQDSTSEKAFGLAPGAFCGPCKWAVDEAVKVANSHANVAVEYLGKVCTVVKPHSPQLAITCDLVVAQFGEKVLADFLAKVESHKACSKARLCPVSQDKSFDEKLDLKDIVCEGCELLFSFASFEFADANFQSAVADISATICNIVPAQLYQSCQTMVEEYMPKILQTVGAIVKPRPICQKIHFCKAQNNQTATFLKIIETNQKNILPPNMLCAPCQWAYRHVQPLVEKSLNTIVNIVSPSVCNVLPAEGVIRAHCKEILEAYGELVGRIVLQKVERTHPCHKIGFCQQQQNGGIQQQQQIQVQQQVQFQAVAPAAQQMEKVFGLSGPFPDFCALCKATLGKAYDQVPVVENQLENAVQPVCNNLADEQAREKCIKMADKFITDAGATVQQALNPEATCKALKLCK